MCLLLVSMNLHGQISFTSAVNLALRNSPRVKMAEADIAKAIAVLSESRTVYIPQLNFGSGLGYSYGFPVGQPTLYNVGIQSLVFDQSQVNSIRAAKRALESAKYALVDARQGVAEDTALTYIALAFDRQRLTVLQQQQGIAIHLMEIVRARQQAEQDSAMELTRSRLTSARANLARLHTESDISSHLAHLSSLTGLPVEALAIDPDSIPSASGIPDTKQEKEKGAVASKAAYLNAESKSQIASGDSRKLYRPQVSFTFRYDRYAEFNNYQDYYRKDSFHVNNLTVGTLVNLPIFNPQLKAKARESLADAMHARYDADRLKLEFLESRAKTIASLAELSAKSEIASLEREIAEQDLEVLQIRLQQGSGSLSPPATPKDEQNARLQERQKYIDLLEAEHQLYAAQISALRMTGQLEEWLRASVRGSLNPQTVVP